MLFSVHYFTCTSPHSILGISLFLCLSVSLYLPPSLSLSSRDRFRSIPSPNIMLRCSFGITNGSVLLSVYFSWRSFDFQLQPQPNQRGKWFVASEQDCWDGGGPSDKDAVLPGFHVSRKGGSAIHHVSIGTAERSVAPPWYKTTAQIFATRIIHIFQCLWNSALSCPSNRTKSSFS